MCQALHLTSTTNKSINRVNAKLEVFFIVFIQLDNILKGGKCHGEKKDSYSRLELTQAKATAGYNRHETWGAVHSRLRGQ